MENIEEKKSNNYKTNTNTDNKNKENLIFKIVILGDSGVGKTSILHYYVFNKCKIFINKSKRIQSIRLLLNFQVKQ